MVLWPGGFESFQSKESDDPCLVFFSDKEHMSLFSFKESSENNGRKMRRGVVDCEV